MEYSKLLNRIKGSIDEIFEQIPLFKMWIVFSQRLSFRAVLRECIVALKRTQRTERTQ